METTGERLVRLRDMRGLSQAQVADIIGVDRTSYAKYEKNVNKPTRKLKELSELFNVTTDYILCNDEQDSVIQSLGASFKSIDDIRFSADLQKDPKKKAFWEAFKNLFMSDQENQQATLPEVPYSKETKKIPIIASVKCGPNGYAFEETDGHVMVDDSYKGNIKAFRCRGDSMNGIGIYEGDIAIVRMQEEVEDGELAVVVINGEEGALKRVRKHEDVLILESYNVAYPPRVFTGKEMNDVRIVGKVMETRRVY